MHREYPHLASRPRATPPYPAPPPRPQSAGRSKGQPARASCSVQRLVGGPPLPIFFLPLDTKGSAFPPSKKHYYGSNNLHKTPKPSPRHQYRTAPPLLSSLPAKSILVALPPNLDPSASRRLVSGLIRNPSISTKHSSSRPLLCSAPPPPVSLLQVLLQLLALFVSASQNTRSGF